MDDPTVYNPLVWAGGFAGALVAALHGSEKLTTYQRVSALIVGTLVAGFLTPAFGEFRHIQNNSSTLPAIAFLAGLCGTPIAALILDALNQAKSNPSVLVTWFKTAYRVWRGQPLDDQKPEPPKESPKDQHNGNLPK